MSGSFISSGMLTNGGNNFLNIKIGLRELIESIIIHNIPLSTNKSMTAIRAIGKLATPFIHSALSPTLCHIAIQLNLFHSEYAYIIEYGQYYSKSSDLKNTETRKSENKYDYFYINEDGVRMTRLSKYSFGVCSLIPDEEKEGQLISEIIAQELYGEIKDKEKKIQELSNSFHRVECDCNNRITLGELCNNFKNEKWLAKNYNVLTHNCQIFASEVIKILKATRKNEKDKIRMNEKYLLPNCLIKALWNNENLSLTNTLGRIPIIGLFHDIAYNIASGKKEK